jgi:AcrR family transcriptional regulator
MLSRQESAAVRDLVDALPAPFREAIVLREFNDMSYREIAEVAGVPLGTVMSRLGRGRALLLAAWQARDGAVQQQGPSGAVKIFRPRPQRAAPKQRAALKMKIASLVSLLSSAADEMRCGTPVRVTLVQLLIARRN